MGNGIAQVFAQSGFEVSLVDAAEAALARARGTIDKSLAKLVEKGKLAADARDAGLGRIKTATTVDVLADADFVVEAIYEDVDAKTDAVRAARRLSRAGRHPRLEHLVDLDHGARRRDEAARPRARHALHEPGAADEARRADSRPGDLGRDDGARQDLCDRLGKTAVKPPTIPASSPTAC